MVPCIPHFGGDQYSPREARERAIKKRNPFLSPHSTFRGIRNTYQAIQFLRDFGPLSSDSSATLLVKRDPPNNPQFFIRLDEFARLQQKFAAITDLWEKLPDIDLLRQAWKQILSASHPPFVLFLTMGRWRPFEGSPGIGGFPLLESGLAEWLASSPPDELRGMTFGLIAHETRQHLAAEIEWIVRPDEFKRPRFTPSAPFTSLWAWMWEAFALDTAAGVSWKICPHCGKVFYPPRRDRFFCTPRQQQLHSKRAWWRARRTSPNRKHRKKLRK